MNGMRLLLALFASARLAQPAELSGRIVDASSGEPLNLAEVREADSPAGPAARTDRDGRFNLTLSEGEHRLRVTLVGYRPLTVSAQPGQELDIALQPDTLRQSERLEVTAGPFGAEQDRAVALVGNELRNLAGALADDPLRAVQSLPGVASNDDFRAQFSIRGAGFERIGVYLDGILIHAPFHTLQGDPSSASLSVIQGELLESANVHTGPLPPAYGDRTAGALDFRTRDGDSRRTSMRVTVGASAAGASAEGPIGSRATWLVAARKSYLQYIINRTSDEPSLGFAFWDVQGKLSYALTPRHHLSLTVIDGHSGLDRDPALVRLGLNAIADSTYRYSLVYASWRYTAGTLLLTQRAGWLSERYDNRNLNRTPLQNGRYREGIWNGDAAKSWTPKLVTEFGWSVRALRDRGFYDRAGTNSNLRIDVYGGTGTRSGAYAQQTWSLTPRVQLKFGGRRDHHTIGGGRGVWLGNGGVSVRAWRGARWHLGWSQTAQYPELQQLLSRGGRRTLEPERSVQTQIGLDQSVGQRARFRFELYNRQDRLLLFQPFFEPRLLPGNRVYIPPLLTGWENSGRGYGRGGQVFFQRRSANGFAGWVSYGYNRARLRDARTGAVYDSDFEARHLIQLFASQRVRPTVNLSGKLVYGSGMPVRGFFERRGPAATDVFLSQSRNLLRLPDYQRTDLRVNKLFVKKRFQLALFAEVINLANRRNVRLDDFGGFDSRTGRAFLNLARTFPILPSAGLVIDF